MGFFFLPRLFGLENKGEIRCLGWPAVLFLYVWEGNFGSAGWKYGRGMGGEGFIFHCGGFFFTT
jgi:hypothetical protein